jgi:hypothetical protein
MRILRFDKDVSSGTTVMGHQGLTQASPLDMGSTPAVRKEEK